MRRLNLISIFAVIFSFPANSDGTIYRWENDSGQVFFGDIPPINSQVKPQKIAPVLDSVTHTTGTGLRPGELQRLKQIRVNVQHETAEESKNERRRLKREAAKAHKAESEEKACNRYRNRIREIDARLRHGCKAAKCARLNEQRNNYKRKASNFC